MPPDLVKSLSTYVGTIGPTNRCGGILQHSQNRITGDRLVKLKKYNNPDSERKCKGTVAEFCLKMPSLFC